jgi:hypothetical protein
MGMVTRWDLLYYLLPQCTTGPFKLGRHATVTRTGKTDAHWHRRHDLQFVTQAASGDARGPGHY